MQLQLPLFPTGATLISDCLGVYQQDELVQSIVNGLPVYAHPKADLKAFRYITSNFIQQGLLESGNIFAESKVWRKNLPSEFLNH